ncbi:MAG: hypothetical protein EA350_13755 [Gemmatimonadales bacterium]|nr:MAG: hypothetical protein EA350_13755 [Gemmatimonadales bacterium]
MNAPGPVDTAELFRPLLAQLIDLLRGLPPEAWHFPAVGDSWRVRDVVAHLIDGDLRRISAQRDGHAPPPPHPINGYRDLVDHLDSLNREWVVAFHRLSPAVLVALAEWSGAEVAAVMEGLNPQGPALYPVAWAGEGRSQNWMDVGREFTEKWHHQQQIRVAVAAPLLLEATWTTPLFRLSMRALPPAFEKRDAPVGTAVSVVVEGEGGGAWSVVREVGGWLLREGMASAPRTVLRLSADNGWRWLYNALPPDAAMERVQIAGDPHWARVVLSARSVMV